MAKIEDELDLDKLIEEEEKKQAEEKAKQAEEKVEGNATAKAIENFESSANSTTNSNEQQYSYTPKPTAMDKIKGIFSFLQPLRDLAQEGAQDAPVISKIDKKLSNKQKNVIGIFILIAFVIIVIILAIIAFTSKDDEIEDLEHSAKQTASTTVGANQAGAQGGMSPNGSMGAPSDDVVIPTIPELSTKAPVIDDKNLEGLIAKADILYKSGQKDDALDIFKNIANFSKGIAYYNLGVISFKSNELPKSLLYYDRAISTGEDVSLSAINAASTAYYNNDIGKFRYYANIADTYLNRLSEAAPYFYVYALSNYYKGQYFEMLSPLEHPNSNAFESDRKRLLSKVYTIFNENDKAFKNLKAVSNAQDNLALGQLLARDGKLDEARTYLQEYYNSNPHDVKGLMSLELLSLKAGDFRGATALLYEYQSLNNRTPIVDPYPIKVRISPLIFDQQQAQQNFWQSAFQNQRALSGKLIFYYAPYRVFNINEAINIISDGILDSKVDGANLEESSSILVKGATISDINTTIAESLKLVNNNDLRGALELTKKYLNGSPNHSILHYNVGLMYAQLGDLSSAYKHFLRAYHLDNSDLQSGIFAMLTGMLIFKDVTTLSHQISISIGDSKLPEDKLKFYIMLKQWILDPSRAYYIAPKDSKALEYALQIVINFNLKKNNNIIPAVNKLKEIYPKDIVTRILQDLSQNFGRDIKDTALNMQYLFREGDVDLDNVLYGASFARELYALIGFITGNLENEKKLLNYKLATQTKKPNGILQALALVSLYNKEFEISYSLYDQLINKLGEDGSDTRFLGAVAAIGAGHNASASLLLQLSKMDSISSYETRYALGLLYQEAGNYNAAAQHYNSISNFSFQSRFLDFTIAEPSNKMPQ